MEPESSLSYSHQPVTGSSPEPYESNPHPHTLFLQDPFQYYPPVMYLRGVVLCSWVFNVRYAQEWRFSQLRL